MKRLEFHISYTCANDCIFCSESMNFKKGRLAFTPANLIRQKLVEFSARGFNHVTFTGGEPSQHPQFIPLIYFSKKLGYRTYITTNGGLFESKTFCQCAGQYLDEICFSVHGHTSKLHNFHTRNRDSFKRLKKGMENIENSSNNIFGFVNIVVTRHNFEFLEKIINFIGNYNRIKQVLISNFAPEGQGLYNFKDLAVPLVKFKEAIPRLISVSLKNRITPRFFGLPLCILKGYEDFSNDSYWSPRVTLERNFKNSSLSLKKTLSYKPIRGRTKPLECRYCQKRDICGGLFKVYYKEFRAGELKSFSQDNMEYMDKSKINQRERATNKVKHWVRLTRVCNNNCIFCLDKDAQNGSCLSVKAIKKDLIRGRKSGAIQAILSGGEPTVHPDFLAIVSLARNLGFQNIQVISNGRMFMYKNFLNAAVKAGLSEVTFSMHGHNEQLHDSQTQVKGSFKQALSGLKNALDIDGLIVNIDVVINKINVRQLHTIIKFFVQVGITEFDLLQVIPFGRAWENRGKLFYDINQELKYLKKAFLLSRDQNLNLWTNRFPPQYLEGFEELIQSPVKLHDEIHGRKKMLEGFLLKGRSLECRGPRCIYCFMRDFCQDLSILAKDKILSPKKVPYCLRNTVENGKSYTDFVLKDKKDILTKFLIFYIENRYFLKRLGCKKCRFYNTCDGAPIKYIRKNGFKPLKAITHAYTGKPDFLEQNLTYQILRLGLECNAKCLFCNVPYESCMRDRISTSQAKKMILSLFKDNPGVRLDISGGEPTLREDLAELISFASKKGIKDIQLQTNAIELADNDYAKALKESGLQKVFVSLHSCNPAIHDYLLGLKGAFKNCVNGIRNAIENGMEVTLNPVITAKSYKELPLYLGFVKKTFPEIKCISLSVIQPRGRAWINKQLVPRYQLISPYIKKGLGLGAKYGIVINNPYCGLPLCIGGWHKYLEHCAEYAQNSLKMKSDHRYKDNNNDKIKGRQCTLCRLDRFCNGVWKEYALLYGLSELRAVK